MPQPSLIFESKKLRNVNLPPSLPSAAALQASPTNSNTHANLDGKREVRNLFLLPENITGYTWLQILVMLVSLFSPIGVRITKYGTRNNVKFNFAIEIYFVIVCHDYDID